MKRFLILLLVVAALVLVACGDGGGGAAVVPEPAAEPVVGDDEGVSDDEGLGEAPAEPAAGPVVHPLEAMDAVLARFPMQIDTGLPHVAGTTFRYAIASETPWSGLFGGGVFSTSTIEAEIQELFFGGSIVSMTPAYTFGQDGIANWSLDLDARTISFTMQQDVYWHDGVALSLDDLVFAYEVIAHPDYAEIGGVRFAAAITQITGIGAFNAGEADYISGLVLSDDNRSLTIHFDEMSPSIMYFGIWTAPMPRHHFAGMTIHEMVESDAVLATPLGWGPFIVQNIVPGESVHLVRNENHVWGVPNVEEVVIERVAPSLVPAAMEAGSYDLVQFPAIYFGDHQNPTNFTFLSELVGDYNYISFRVGHWDFDNNRNVFDPNRLMSNVNLRRAMGFAVDEAPLADLLFHGLRFPAATNAPTHHRVLLDTTVPGFPYNPAEANRLLDEAGFVDVTGDGFRDDPEGNPMTIMWAYPTGPQEEIITAYYIQSWAAVGLRVELWQGRTHDQFYLWDILDFDDCNDEIDIYTGAWSPGADPNPDGAWGHAIWNASRYTSPEYDAILARIGSSAAFDEAYMQQAFSDWQWYWYNNMPYYPTQWRVGLWAVNDRVTFWDNAVGSDAHRWRLTGLSSAEAYSR